MLRALSDQATEGVLRAWMAPVWTVLDIAQSEIEEQREPLSSVATKTRRPQRYVWMRSPKMFAARFGVLDASWRTRESELFDADWSAVDPAQRDAFGEQLLHWPDAIVRERAVRAFVVWNDRRRLLALLSDPCFMVRKAATFWMRELGPDPELASYVWEQRQHARSTHLYETLETAIALSAPESWWERVETLVADPTQQEAERFHAVQALGKAGARDAIAANLDLLLDPPVLTWSIHEALVEWALKMELALPDLSHLRDEDHLVVQTMLASAGRSVD